MSLIAQLDALSDNDSLQIDVAEVEKRLAAYMHKCGSCDEDHIEWPRLISDLVIMLKVHSDGNPQALDEMIGALRHLWRNTGLGAPPAIDSGVRH